MKALPSRNLSNGNRKGIGEMGVLGINLKGYGCPACPMWLTALHETRTGRLRFEKLCVRSRLFMYVPHLGFGSEEQKNKYLPKMASADPIVLASQNRPRF